MGKFSQPRNHDYGQDDLTQRIHVSPIEEPEIPVLPLEEVPDAMPVIPETHDDFFDTPEYRKPKAKQSGFSSNKTRKVLLISLCAVSAVLLIAFIGAFAFLSASDPYDGKILNNVSVAGVNVGNMTKAEAKAAIRAATDNTYATQPMVIKFPDTQITLDPASTGAKLDVNAAVDAAYDYGRTGTKEERERAVAASMNSEHPIALLPYLSLNQDYIKNALDTYAASFNSIYIPSSVTLEGEMPILDANDPNFKADAPCQILTFNMGTPGRNIDIKDVFNRVLDAYSFNQFEVVVEMDEEEAIPEPIDLDSVIALYITEGRDAVVNNETYEVTMEVYGYGFDIEEAKYKLETSTYGDIFTIPMSMIAPGTTGGNVKDVVFRDILCEYKTEHTDNEKRNTNLDLACKAINGTILEPGEEFDFNTIVGKRTKERGYQYAPAYSSGKTVPTLGGGICQVSSTIYYCCLIADLEIINRQPHSFVSSYMPLGMDATVSWNGPEFTFRNNTNYPIRIETWVADGYVHAKLVGTDEKPYYIEMEYDVLAYYSYDSVTEVYPPDNAEGYVDGEVIQTPYQGCSVRTYKLKYDKVTKELLSKEEDRVSKYKKRDRITVSIQAPTEPPTEAPTTPPATPTDPPATPTDPPATPTTPPSGSGSGGSDSSGSGSGSEGSSGSGSGSEGSSGSGSGSEGSSGSGSGSESSSGSGSGSESSSGSGSGSESSSGSGSGSGGSSGSGSGSESSSGSGSSESSGGEGTE